MTKKPVRDKLQVILQLSVRDMKRLYNSDTVSVLKWLFIMQLIRDFKKKSNREERYGALSNSIFESLK